MDNSFYFNLARVSAAQILRAAGIDRTRPSTLDILTDILLRYFHLLGTESMTFALAAGRGEANTRDVRVAMEDIGLIANGRLVSKKRVQRIARERRGMYKSGEDDTDRDGEDQSDESTETLDKLLSWFKGSQAAECRRVAGVSSSVTNGLNNLSVEHGQRQALVPDYVTSSSLFFGLILGLIQNENGQENGMENGVGGINSDPRELDPANVLWTSVPGGEHIDRPQQPPTDMISSH
jgi:histone H3/H4